MTLGEKLKEIRRVFGFTQEELADIMKVSRQAITKWESDSGIPDISNLQELSKIFNISVDYLIDENEYLNNLTMTKKLKTKKSYKEVLDEYYGSWDKYVLSPTKKMNKLETFFDFLIGGDYFLIKNATQLSPFYLVVNGELKFLVNIHDSLIKISPLPSNTKIKRFSYGQNYFINCGKLK